MSAAAVAKPPSGFQSHFAPVIKESTLVQWRLTLTDAQDLRQLQRLLAKVPLFAETSDSFREKIAKVCLPMEYPEGSVVVNKDSNCDWMGIVLRGSLGLLGSARALHEVRPGGTFGDINVLGLSETSTMTVTARRFTMFLMLDRASFDRIVGLHRSTEPLPRIVAGIALRQQLASASTICGLQCFQRLERPMVQELFTHMTPVLMYEGSVLMKEGQQGDEMYLLQSGQVKVEKKQEFLCHLPGGTVMGELAVLGADKRRRATITVTALSLFYVLRGDLFKATLQKYPQSQRLFDHDYICRVVSFDLDLVQDERARLDSFHGNAHPKSNTELYEFCKENTRLDMEFLNPAWHTSRRAGTATGSSRRNRSTASPLPPRPQSEPLPQLHTPR